MDLERRLILGIGIEVQLASVSRDQDQIFVARIGLESQSPRASDAEI